MWVSNQTVQQQVLVDKWHEHCKGYDRLLIRCKLDMKLAGICTFGSVRRNAGRMALPLERVGGVTSHFWMSMGAAEAKFWYKDGGMH